MRFRTPRTRRRAVHLLSALLLAPALVVTTATAASATDPVRVWGTTPTVQLGSMLDSLLNPSASVNVCSTAGMDAATCDQAYAAVRAAAGCLAPFVTDPYADATRCRSLPQDTTALLNAVAGEAVACANGANAICDTASDAAVSGVNALVRCLAGDAITVGATRVSPVTGDGGTIDLYAVCGAVVEAAAGVAAAALDAATACATGADATCAAIVGTTLHVVDAALRCLGTESGLDGGPSLLAADLAGACASAVQTGRDTLAALVARVIGCVEGADATCHGAIERAGAVAGEITAQAGDLLTEAGRCQSGQGDSTAVSACRAVLGQIGRELGHEDGDLPVVVDTTNAAVGVNVTTVLTAEFAVALDPTYAPEFDAATKATTITDEAGKVVLDTREQVEGLTQTSATGTTKSCVLSGDELKKRAIKAYPPMRSPREFSDKGMDHDYIVHVYQSDMARPLVGVGYTWQVETCMAGGAQTFNGFRLRQTGQAVTVKVPGNVRIDQAWKTGEDLPDVEATLYAHVGSEQSPVQVGASVSQRAVGRNSGAAGTRLPQPNHRYDPFKHNGALSKWDTKCGWFTQDWACGSRDYQGSVLHALYEFPRTDPGPHTLSFVWFGDRRCTTASGSCKT